MDALEKAIRSAFEKGNAEDPAFREKVYKSAFAALDRALQANPKITVEAAINRRKSMQAKIAEIESEYLAAAAETQPAATPGIAEVPSVSAERAEPAPVAAPEIAPEIGRRPAAAVAPEVSLDGGRPNGPGRAPEISVAKAAPAWRRNGSGPAPRLEPRMDGDTPAAREPLGAPRIDPDRNEARARKRRRPFAAIFLVIVLLAAVAIGGWWAFQTGLFPSLAEREASAPSAPAQTEGEGLSPVEDAAPLLPGQSEASREWVSVFSPSDPTLATAPTGATAEVMQDDSGSFMRIRSDASGAAVSFDVGQGVLEQFAGQKATFDIIARAAEGEQTEMAVECNFGELGDCGRKRYALGYERSEFLFEVDLRDAQPGAGGTIAINSDFAGQGRAVDIYEIRVSTTE